MGHFDPGLSRGNFWSFRVSIFHKKKSGECIETKLYFINIKCTNLYLYRRVCVCVSVCVPFQALYTSRLWSDRNQIWHTHADSHRKGSGQNKHLPLVT